MKNIQIVRLEREKRKTDEDTVAEEVLLKLILNNRFITKFSCSGNDINELIVGFLFYHQYINDLSDIVTLNYNIESAEVHAKTEPQKPVFSEEAEFAKLTYNVKDIYQLMDKFLGMSEQFKKTGAVHSAAIADNEGIKFSFEDLSRHNALFKILGYSITQNIMLQNKMLLLTCRITKSILDIIRKSNVTTIISKAAPTDLSVEICRTKDISLAGFVRGERMNIYHGENYFLSHRV
ncbi:MAG: formate dehydrogenase accessory sulfurtransferase FdhD [Bacteroidales bacterium]